MEYSTNSEGNFIDVVNLICLNGECPLMDMTLAFDVQHKPSLVRNVITKLKSKT